VNGCVGLIGKLVLGASLALGAICVVLPASVPPARAAVQLADFHVEFYDDHALITWVTGSELGTYGFNIFRAEVAEFSRAQQINPGMIEASGERTGNDYYYTDDGLEPGVTYYYWLEIVDPDDHEIFGPEPEPSATPTSTSTAAGTPTRTPTRTKTPVPTSTSIPTQTPSFTATGVPTSMPTFTPPSMAVPTTPPAASPTLVPEQASTPSATIAELVLPTFTLADAQGSLTPSLTSTPIIVASEESPGDEGVVPASPEQVAPWWSSLRSYWPTIYPSTILFSISMISLVGVVLLSLALVLLRRFSL
jgi:hypothetical protein